MHKFTENMASLQLRLLKIIGIWFTMKQTLMWKDAETIEATGWNNWSNWTQLKQAGNYSATISKQESCHSTFKHPNTWKLKTARHLPGPKRFGRYWTTMLKIGSEFLAKKGFETNEKWPEISISKCSKTLKEWKNK